jgi:regulator of replication initiation timing
VNEDQELIDQLDEKILKLETEISDCMQLVSKHIIVESTQGRSSLRQRISSLIEDYGFVKRSRDNLIEETQEMDQEIERLRELHDISDSNDRIYAIHVDGHLVGSKQNIYTYANQKRIYYELGHAKRGIRHLPKDIRNRAEIVEYIPMRTVYRKDEN